MLSIKLKKATKNARERDQNFSKDEQEQKRPYGCGSYKNFPENEKENWLSIEKITTEKNSVWKAKRFIMFFIAVAPYQLMLLLTN